MMRQPRRLLLGLAILAAALAGLAGCASILGAVPPRRLPQAPWAAPAAPIREAGLERLLAAMTLEEKVGQLMVIAFSGPAFSAEAEQMVRAYHVGGVILFQQNLSDAAQIRRLTGQLQDSARLPLLIGVDQEGGPVVRVMRGATLFPSQMAIGATFSPEVAAAVAGATARELRDLGMNVNFGPVVDVNSNPQNPVIGVRSYGASPSLVSRLATAAIAATQQAGVLAVAKHFPGHGDADVDSHHALPVIGHDLGRLRAVELPPFQAAIAAGVDGVMTAHVLLPALEPDPKRSATLSPAALRYLREDLGYQGLIITDDLEMGAIVNDYGTAAAAKLAFQAGADLLLFRRNVVEQQQAHRLLLEAAQSGEIPAQRLDASVRRILAAKARLNQGLGGKRQEVRTEAGAPEADTSPRASPGAPVAGAAAAHEAPGAGVALDAARRSVTLLRNEGGLLPLRLTPDAPVCVIFPRPEAVSEVEIAAPAAAGAAGGGASEPQTLGEAARAIHPGARLAPVGLRPTAQDTQAALSCARTAQVVVLGTYNLHEYPPQAALMKSVAALGKPVIAVALRLPYDLAQIEAAALVAIYSNRPASLVAAAEALFGHGAAPAGHLPVPVGARWTLGFGLLDWSRPASSQ